MVKKRSSAYSVSSTGTHWVPHDEGVWVPGSKIGDDEGGVAFTTEMGKVIVPTAKVKDLITIDDEHALQGIEDICMLSNVSDASLLHAVRIRYSRDEIYTYISCILVAVNPFKRINMYSSEQIEMYRENAGETPHIFGVCSTAWNGMLERQKSQSILVSGESGAGKTESTKFVLLYVSSVLRSDAGLEDKLLQINPILEAFGNAKTVRNDNSSRFGKWIQVNISPSSMKLSGASVTDYLLEVTRVCSQGQGERNYHVFYQLTTQKAREEFPMLKLESAGGYEYLKRNPSETNGIDDVGEYQQLREALAALKFSGEEEQAIYKICAGLLHLGNVDLQDDNANNGSTIKNVEALELAAEVLGVDKEALSKCIRFKRRVTKDEVLESPLDAAKGRQARDSTAKLIYGRLFQWLVIRSNEALGAELDVGNEETGRPDLFVGVLDIAGFEFFETNLLEQLFINMSNEKLQQFFNNAVFKSEIAEYAAEGIPVSAITYQDNQHILDLIEGTGGILQTLDDATMGVRLSDEQYTSKIIKDHDRNKNFTKPKFTKDNPMLFGIIHYAGEVMYTTEGFVEKNVAVAPTEILEMMGASGNEVLREISEDLDSKADGKAKSAATAKPGPRGAGAASKKTVSASFRRSLTLLINKLNKTEANFIRCIKPNKDKVPGKFDSTMVAEQLKLSGAMETVKIRQSGYLHRSLCRDFVGRYMLLAKKESRDEISTKAGSTKPGVLTKEADAKKAAEALVALLPKLGLEIKPGEMMVGKTKVFLKGEPYRDLEDNRKKRLLPVSISLQRHVRGFITRKVMKEVLDVNRGLIKCTAEAGEMDFSGIVPIKENLARATVAENALSQMDTLLDRAVRLPIKLPRLPTYIAARTKFAAQATLARQLSDAKTSTRVPWMEALLARAVSYGIKGQLVDELKEHSAKVGVQLQHRRALQDCAFYDVLDDAVRVVEAASQAGLEKADAWVVPDGAENFNAAAARRDQLEVEQKERAKAIEELRKQMEGMTKSIDAAAIDALLVQSTAFNMKDALVDELRERCDQLELQQGSLTELRKCCMSQSVDIAEHQVVIDAIKERGLDVPSKWVYQDGSKLYATVLETVNNIEHGKVVQTVAAEVKANAAPETEAVEDQEEADLFASNTVPELKSLKLLLEVPNVQKCMGDDLSTKLSDRCTSIEEQLEQRRELQAACAASSLSEVDQALEKVGKAGLDAANKWVLPEGPRLHEIVVARKAQLEQAQKATATMAEEVQKELAEGSNSADHVYVSALLARAEAYGVSGELVDKARSRLDALVIQRPLRLKLLACQVSDSEDQLAQAVSEVKEAGLDKNGKWIFDDCEKLYENAERRLARVPKMSRLKRELAACVEKERVEDIEKVLAEAREAGLDTQEAWLVADGHSCWEAAVARQKELQQDQDRRDALAKGLREQLEQLLSSQDTAAMKALLPQLTHVNIEAWKVTKLKNRYEALEAQLPLRTQLQACLTWKDEAKIQVVLAKVSEAGLDNEAAWLLPDGAKGVRRARRWLARLQSQQAQNVWLASQIEKRLGAAMHSLDEPMMQKMITEAEAYSVKTEVLDQLRSRRDIIAKQCKSLVALQELGLDLGSLDHKIPEAEHAGLGSASSALFPHGPRCVARAQEWRGLVAKLNDAETVSSSSAAAKEVALAGSLKSSLQSCELGTVTAALEEAKKEDLELPGSWSLASGPVLLSLAELHSLVLQDAQEAVMLKRSDMEWEVGSLVELLEAPLLKSMMGTELCCAAKGRSDALQEQAKHQTSLQASIVADKLQEVQSVHTGLQSAGLSSPENWLLPDGPRLASGAARRLEQLKKEAQVAEEATGQVDQQLKDLQQSVDLVAMRGTLARADRCKCNEELRESLRKRTTALQQQLLLRKELQACAICEDLHVVVDVVSKMREAELDGPGNWIVEDGPKLFARAISRQDQLQRVEAIKTKISAAASKLDAVELQEVLSEAAELGISAQTHYAAEYEVFLKLQDGSFVNSKLGELQASPNKESEAVYLLMIGNLTEQLKVLGLPTEPSTMQSVAKELMSSVEKRPSVSQAARKSIFDKADPIQRMAGQVCFSALCNFSKLRDPLSFGNVPEGSDALHLQESMLSFSSAPITRSLTELPEALEPTAVRVFTDIQRRMGDQPNCIKTELDEPIFHVAREDPALCDEVYIQLMKQLSGNPSTGSAETGWDVFQALPTVAVPSAELREFVRGFLQKIIDQVKARPAEGEEGAAQVMKRKSIRAEAERRLTNHGSLRAFFLQEREPKLASDTLAIFLEECQKQPSS